MSRYASETSVPVVRSRAEIETTLSKYGATAFASAHSGDRAQIMFEFQGWRVLFTLPLPARADFFTRLKYGRRVEATPEWTEQQWEQACRQRWRALALVVKAKLEAVECGITSFEQEFLAHIVLPGGHGTAGSWLIPQLKASYASGTLPPLLSSGGP